METLRMYLKLVSISFRGRIQFRTDFLVGLVSVVVLNIFRLATIGVVLSHFQSLAGWTIWEIVFLYNLWLLGHSLFSMLFWHMEELDYFITQGTFDMFLIRPISPFLQFVSQINYTGFADTIVGAVGLAIAVANLHFHWVIWHTVYLIVVILSATLIEFSITLALTCIAFWTGRAGDSIKRVMQVNFVIQRYPVDMFGRWFQIFVTCFLPVAFINFYPARLLLGKVTPGDPWYWLSFMSPVVSLILLRIATLVWKFALKHYNSSGG